MKKIILKTTLALALIAPSIAMADQAKGLNVLVNSDNKQTQAMAMVLSLMTMKKHKKEVNIVLCGSAGDLANKNTYSSRFSNNTHDPDCIANRLQRKEAG